MMYRSSLSRHMVLGQSLRIRTTERNHIAINNVERATVITTLLVDTKGLTLQRNLVNAGDVEGRSCVLALLEYIRALSPERNCMNMQDVGKASVQTHDGA